MKTFPIPALTTKGAVRIILLLTLLTPPLWGQRTQAVKCGFSDPNRHYNKTAAPQARNLDFLDEFLISPSGEFRIHYTRIGSHAVSGSDNPGTPVFVVEAAIAADSAYSILVNELGFLPPLADENVDGPELDIYLVDMKLWEGSYYGITYFEDSAPSVTYLVIDNDYVESNYATQGLDALRVTIAHEFFHMVQLRYAYPFEPVSSNAYWYEISSTWMEEKCYPEVNDYHAYVAYNFRQSYFPNLNDDRNRYAFSYGHGLFGQVLDQEYGMVNDKHIMLDIWENLRGNEATDNLETVLSSLPWHSSLTDALEKYGLYNVFTGSRSIAGMYYPDAPDLAEINTRDYELPLSYPVEYEFPLDVFEIAYKRFQPPIISDFYVRAEIPSENQRILLTYHSYDNGSSLKSPFGDFWTACENVSSQDYLIFPIVNGDRETGATLNLLFEGRSLKLDDAIQTLWPNPSDLKLSSIQLSLILSAPGYIRINVYNLLGHQVFKQFQYSPEGIRIVELDLPKSTPSGIYFVQLITERSRQYRKFSVIK